MLDLKGYQQRTLDSLHLFFAECRKHGDPGTAFVLSTKTTLGRSIPYNEVLDLPGLPYVCLRIPTGGGKTLLAAHAVGMTATELLRTDSSVVLWLVPSNTIRDQTLKTLRDRRHPYREALESGLGSVEVMDVSEALSAPRARYDDATVVIVATVQAFRVEETEGRKVYEDNGSLLSHFSGLPPESLDGLERFEDGTPRRSLANVLRLRRPVVVVDEAHNSRTPLSFRTLARFAPACILELTATPNMEPSDENPPSNVLHTVSAAELAAEDMIKMPLQLVNRSDWKESVADAVKTRAALEEIGRKERGATDEYIRPIVLLQAEPDRKNAPTVTVEMLRNALLEDHRIPVEQVRVATGEKDELGDEDLSSPSSPVRFVVTKQKLREGWDCPFAYVLCTVAETHSRVAVEQLVGRVLRLPRAKRKQHAELNKAFVFSCVESFSGAVQSMTDALVKNGFERQDAEDLVVAAPADERNAQGDLFAQTPERASVAAARIAGFPDAEKLPQAARDVVRYDAATETVTLTGPLANPVAEEVAKYVPSKEGQAAFRELARRANAASASPAERGEAFAVPWLAVAEGEQRELWEPFEETHLIEHAWTIAERDAFLLEEHFAAKRPEGQAGEVYVTEKGDIRSRYLERVQFQIGLLGGLPEWTEATLAWWLERNLARSGATDIEPQDFGIFLLHAIRYLTEERKISLRDLVFDKYRLFDALRERVNSHRAAARREAFQTFLLGKSEARLVVTPEICFRYGREHEYPYNTRYAGKHEFSKHFYKVVGDLKPDGEEHDCALHLDSHPSVRFWVRNLAQRPQHAFWLQTSTDKFYPDFVALLQDGRVLVVEYKNDKDWTNDDSKEKRALGEMWESRSEGRCLFAMPRGKTDLRAIDAKIESAYRAL